MACKVGLIRDVCKGQDRVKGEKGDKHESPTLFSFYPIPIPLDASIFSAASSPASSTCARQKCVRSIIIPDRVHLMSL